MSHIVSIAVEVRDSVALEAACKRLELPAPVERTVRFYDGSEVGGQAVELTGWRYPVVFDLDGGMKYDDFEGRWGERRHPIRCCSPTPLRRRRSRPAATATPPTNGRWPTGPFASR